MAMRTPARDSETQDRGDALGEASNAAGPDPGGVLDSLDLPIIMIDSAGTVARFNRAAAATLRLTPADIGLSLCHLSVLADVKDIEQLGARVLADGVPFRRELRDGDRWFVLRIAPCSGTGRAPGGIVLTFTNVTAFRASIEQAIYEREYTKTILNTVIAALVVLDSDLRVQTANRAFFDLFGVRRESTQGVPLADLGNHDWKTSPLWEALKTALSSNSDFQTFEFEGDFRPAGRRTVLIDARRLPHAGAATILLAFQDITERKRAKQALEASERRFRQMIDALPAAVYTTDAEGRLTHFNPACIELAGRTPELGRDHWCVTWKLYHPDGTRMPHDECPMAVALKEGRIIRGAEAIAERPDGTRIWFMPYPTPLRDSTGAVVGGINMLVDITERKWAEQSLRAADRRKDEFLATLAHELRNPLAPVRNSLEIMKRAQADAGLLEQARITMDRQMSQMERLVDDLLDVSRITRDKLELRKQPVELASALNQSVEVCRPLAERANHVVTVTVPPEPIYLDADPVRLAQLFSNLLNNACKYTPPGGRIGLTAERHGRDVTVTIKDSGVGIPPDMLPRVFDMFTQVDRSLERSQGGLGIGLTLVKRLVEMHGGSVEAFSAGPGRGSEFIVRLPLLVDEPNVAQPERTFSKQGVTGRRILIVDDNRDAAESLAMLLKLAGQETLSIFDSPEALCAVEKFRPDVVLLDIGLPKMNGHEVARRLREQSWGKDLVLVALTGWGQDEDRRKTQEAGFDAHMVKPVDFDELMKLLDSLPSEQECRSTKR